jgi:hypothetical protein
MSTTDLEEVKRNIVAAAQALLRDDDLLIRLCVYQEQDTAQRKAGGYNETMSFNKFLQYRTNYLRQYGGQHGPLNEMDVAYMNAETEASNNRKHHVQILLLLIDQLSLILAQQRVERPVSVIGLRDSVVTSIHEFVTESDQPPAAEDDPPMAEQEEQDEVADASEAARESMSVEDEDPLGED